MSCQRWWILQFPTKSPSAPDSLSERALRPQILEAMLFNSIEFLLFLPLVFAAYWSVNGRAPLRIQNLLLLAASYLFYGWWDWRFLSLVAFSTLVDFAVGLQIAKANDREIPQDAGPSERSRTAKRWLAEEGPE